MTDERIQLPRAVRFILMTYMGYVGLYMVSFELKEEGALTTAFIILSASVFTSCMAYGVVSLIADIRNSRTWRGFVEILQKKIDDALGKNEE